MINEFLLLAYFQEVDLKIKDVESMGISTLREKK